MRRLTLCVGVLTVLGMAPAMFADIQDYMLNINGSTYCPALAVGCTSSGGLAAAPGTVSTLNTSSGLGSVTVTFTGAPGTYNVNFWLFEELIPTTGLNEYGKVNGAPAAGQTYQIDVPDYDLGGDPNLSAQGTIIANTAASTLANQNNVPGKIQLNGTTGDCEGGPGPNGTSPNCNDFTSLAMGFSFTLTGGDEEVVTFSATSTAPAGFSLQQVHPAGDPDLGGANAEMDYFLSGSAVNLPITVGPVPEPGSIVLLATLAGVVLWAFRRRAAKLQGQTVGE